MNGRIVGGLDLKVIIMAGGRGTRIASVSNTVPKPMVKIGKKPVLEYEIECLRRQGYTDIVITVSHLAEQIMDYFGDGSHFGVRIQYFMEESPLGNAGAIFKLWEQGGLDGDFLLLIADALFDIDFARFVDFHKKHNALATLFTHPNSHPYDSGLVVSDSDTNIITNWLTKEDVRPSFYRNRVNAGIHILSTDILPLSGVEMEEIGESRKVDLDRDILKPLVHTKRIYSYDSPEYVKDMGTPERFYAVCKDVENGLVYRRNLRYKQKAVFLDRDGTLNEYVGYLRSADQFVLLPDVAEAIRLINASGYLAIVVTNQPVIARGEVTVAQLELIHHKLETLLGMEGAYIDALFYCPHHPMKGFDGEIAELKMDCECRKPKPGLLLKAAEKYNIDMRESWMIGDGERDIQAGKNAGCRTVLISGGGSRGDYGQDLTVRSLLEFVRNEIA